MKSLEEYIVNREKFQESKAIIRLLVGILPIIIYMIILNSKSYNGLEGIADLLITGLIASFSIFPIIIISIILITSSVISFSSLKNIKKIATEEYQNIQNTKSDIVINIILKILILIAIIIYIIIVLNQKLDPNISLWKMTILPILTYIGFYTFLMQIINIIELIILKQFSNK